MLLSRQEDHKPLISHMNPSQSAPSDIAQVTLGAANNTATRKLGAVPGTAAAL
jgi:hypothetical protein